MTHRISEANNMSSEFNELLPSPAEDKASIWIVGTREQVEHFINELYVKRVVSDRAHFSPIVAAPFAPGKWMVIVTR
jgi:hypothetical protein